MYRAGGAKCENAALAPMALPAIIGQFCTPHPRLNRMLTTQKKPTYPIRPPLREYLARYGREVQLPVMYSDLYYFHAGMPLLDKNGKDTLWQTVAYQAFDMPRIHRGLKEIYAQLRAGGDQAALEHLYVDRIDYCSFGNSQPFRVRIV